MPSRSALVGFLRGAGCPEQKVTHCERVADVALAVGRKMQAAEIPVDLGVVEIGALLHDVGVAFTRDDLSPEHCALGADFLRANGFTETVARCVERHECIARPEAAELGNFPQPLRDTYVPETVEERIIAFADLMYFAVVEKRSDPWQDPDAVGRASFGYMDAVFRKKLGRAVPKTYPIFARVVALTRTMLVYVPHETFARWVAKQP
ncbi:MAG TPA: HDIG domain-containing protein [bacterium]|nr:HDIG domain-containing protein [bacterium]